MMFKKLHRMFKVNFRWLIIIQTKYFIEQATELQQDVVAAAHVAEEQAIETAHNVQGKFFHIIESILFIQKFYR